MRRRRSYGADQLGDDNGGLLRRVGECQQAGRDRGRWIVIVTDRLVGSRDDLSDIRAGRVDASGAVGDAALHFGAVAQRDGVEGGRPIGHRDDVVDRAQRRR